MNYVISVFNLPGRVDTTNHDWATNERRYNNTASPNIRPSPKLSENSASNLIWVENKSED